MDSEKNTCEQTTDTDHRRDQKTRRWWRHPVVLMTVAAMAAGLFYLLVIGVHWGDEITGLFEEPEHAEPCMVVDPNKTYR